MFQFIHLISVKGTLHSYFNLFVSEVLTVSISPTFILPMHKNNNTMHMFLRFYGVNAGVHYMGVEVDVRVLFCMAVVVATYAKICLKVQHSFSLWSL